MRALLCAGLLAPLPVHAQVPYEKELLRLAEILGSLHYLRNLCGEEGGIWRNEMQKLIEIEKPDEAHRSRMIANFNRGYRSYGELYRQCTPMAVQVIERYTEEGGKIAETMSGRYGP
ncbi:TIGR02301 family protein [Limoniibacter endophyticus]|uniref:TIGR02301 family protein n=1 Tax=Limoniibacter endophyticus TaxID=1565040 RepID=A0A8J3DMX1_9HYPH|nr:TIGR02301 family protein [Limoniibacter endophyticus]